MHRHRQRLVLVHGHVGPQLQRFSERRLLESCQRSGKILDFETAHFRDPGWNSQIGQLAFRFSQIAQIDRVRDPLDFPQSRFGFPVVHADHDQRRRVPLDHVCDSCAVRVLLLAARCEQLVQGDVPLHIASVADDHAVHAEPVGELLHHHAHHGAETHGPADRFADQPLVAAGPRQRLHVAVHGGDEGLHANELRERLAGLLGAHGVGVLEELPHQLRLERFVQLPHHGFGDLPAQLLDPLVLDRIRFWRQVPKNIDV